MSWRQGPTHKIGGESQGGRWRRGRSPPPTATDREPPSRRGGRDGRGEGEGGGSRRRGGATNGDGRGGGDGGGGGASSWDLKAQRRERAMWGAGMRALEGLVSQGQEHGEGSGQGTVDAGMAAMGKVLDELSTVSGSMTSEPLRPRHGISDWHRTRPLAHSSRSPSPRSP